MLVGAVGIAVVCGTRGNLRGLDAGDALKLVAIQIPARSVAEMGKQRVDAGLHLRRVEAVFEFSALAGNFPVAANLDRTQRARGIRAAHPEANGEIVTEVQSGEENYGGDEGAFRDDIQEIARPPILRFASSANPQVFRCQSESW